MVLVDTEVFVGMVGPVIGVVDKAVAAVGLLSVTRLWESWSVIGSGGIRFGCTVLRVALDVCVSSYRDRVQSIVDVSFGHFLVKW